MKSGLIYFDRIKKVKSRGTYNSRALKSMPFKTNFPRLFIRYNKNTSHPEFMHPSSLTWSQEMTIAFLENYLMHDQMKVFSYHAEESNKKHKKKPALIRSEYYILKERINRLFEFLGIEPQNLGTLLDLSELKSELTNRSEGILIARQLRDELLEKDLSKTTTENIPYELPEGEQYLSERLDELFRDISFKDLRIKLPNEVKRHGKGRKD